MSDLPAEYAEMVDVSLPGGRYTLAPWQGWLVADALGDDPGDTDPHPVLAWMASVGGMGLTWDELFAWFGATAEDGPMFGEHRTTLHTALTYGTFDVAGRITSVDRKSGRSGTFDIVGYELELWRSGDRVATCWNSLVLPRKETS
ncbi:hypothetical protein [Gordonia zhaorongruii]|uniref:hypothetical protein n=1 Tax=Gordonia zhaorongruii TaxID=2597659 RepID=UPI001F38D5B6|nr:hypothetical protein [Gordonia zhaorongruii]